ncbi:MAG TPA: type II toxin-antitoxin system VapC family toxin [Verrucomicrobiae bacterium]|jgi:predicted nucleic acid-binding protein|nr:type II toxin-antitoxin system VapC family toxin [Verrucomicrobiae bacterium]
MYLDSCIIVKLVSHEPDSEAYHRVVAGKPVVTSELAVTEVRSALLAKERTGRISAQARHAGWRLFQEKVRDEEFVLLPLSRQIIERAGGMIEQCHPQVVLRTLDAIHVATAELCGGEEMCSSDNQVMRAADFIGLAYVPSLKEY